MTLRLRKKPPTTAQILKTVHNQRTRPFALLASLGRVLCIATVTAICLPSPAFGQTQKPAWSAQRPAVKKSLSSAKVSPTRQRRSSASTFVPKQTLSSSLLGPHDLSRKFSVPTPRVSTSTSSQPVAAKSPPFEIVQSAAPTTAPTLAKPKVPTKVAANSQKVEAKPEAISTAPSKSAAKRLIVSRAASTPPLPSRITNAHHAVPVRTVRTSRSGPRKLVLRSSEMPILRPTPKSKQQQARDKQLAALPKVQQPGSLRLVQFQDSLAQADSQDDSTNIFDLPNSAKSAQPTESPSPIDLFNNPPSTTTAEAVPTDSTNLFQDTSQPEPIAAPAPVDPVLFDRTPSLSEPTISPVDDSRAAPQFSKTGAEIQAEIEESLRNKPALPSLGGPNEGDAPNDLSDEIEEALKSPFGKEENDSTPDPGRDLSSTNGRDCQASQQACIDEMAFLRRREQTNMSVDITPSIEPREFDMTKVDEVRIEKLAKSPSHTWKDRSGQVIVDGTFEDYRNGKVIVRTVNGTMRSIPDYRLSNSDRSFVNAWWELPDECHFEDEQFAMRDFRMTTFTWAAAATCHKPLYFEEVNVERYGHTAGPILQPLASGAHFFGSVAMMPYHMGLTPPNECVYPLGYYRPGDCAPWIVRGFPMTTRGFKWQALALGAGIALLP